MSLDSHSLTRIISCPMGTDNRDRMADATIVPRVKWCEHMAKMRQAHQVIQVPQSKGGRGLSAVTLSAFANIALQDAVNPEMSTM